MNLYVAGICIIVISNLHLTSNIYIYIYILHFVVIEINIFNQSKYSHALQKESQRRMGAKYHTDCLKNSNTFYYATYSTFQIVLVHRNVHPCITTPHTSCQFLWNFHKVI